MKKRNRVKISVTSGNQEYEVLLISGCIAKTALNGIDKTKRNDQSLAQFSVGWIFYRITTVFFD